MIAAAIATALLLSPPADVPEPGPPAATAPQPPVLPESPVVPEPPVPEPEVLPDPAPDASLDATPLEPPPAEVEEPTLAPDPASPGSATARIEARLVDTEIDTAPISEASVRISCTCLPRSIITTPDKDGRISVDALPPGIYTVSADRGGRPVRRVIGLAAGQRAAFELEVPPPITTAEIERRAQVETQARTMMALGGVALVGAGALLIAAGVEQAKPDCKFGLDTCASAPRANVTAWLGVGGGLLAVTGGTLVGVGYHRLRSLRASVAMDDKNLAVVVRGRF